MNTTYEHTLALLANALHGRDYSIDSDSFKDVFEELKAQSVVALPAEIINKLNFSLELQMEYLKLVAKNVQQFHKIGKTQTEIIEILNSQNIKFAVVKGFAASNNYPVPEYRSYGDIDLLIDPDRFTEALKLLVDRGYKQEDSNDPRHVSFVAPSGVEVELHFRFSSVEDKKHNLLVDEIILGGLSHTNSIFTNGYKLPVLPVYENGLVFISHINHHLSSGIGLRQIIDWMLYVERYMDNETWEQYRHIYQKIGMERLALVTTATCKKYLGMNSTITWADEFLSEDITERFIEYVMMYGNFSRKDHTTNYTVTVVREFRNPLRGIALAQRQGIKNWKVVKKYPILKPFAWIYQIIRWISRGSKRGLKVSDMKSLKSKENVETEFLKELGVTRI